MNCGFSYDAKLTHSDTQHIESDIQVRVKCTWQAITVETSTPPVENLLVYGVVEISEGVQT